jgi:diguanylate cyclase (GGDEF)-like protein
MKAARSAQLRAAKIPKEYRHTILDGLQLLRGEMNFLTQRLQQALGHDFHAPSEVREVLARLEELLPTLKPQSVIPVNVDLPSQLWPIAKNSILAQQRRIFREVERTRRNAHSHEAISAVEAKLDPFKHFAEARWYKGTKALRVPRESDYLTRQYLQQQSGSGSLQFDPKFGILLSASQFTIDAARIKSECESRGVAFTVLFMDVDDFKALNSKYGEPLIDRELLPALMRHLDAALFGHGTIYRYGGDEFVALLENHSEASVAPLVVRIRESLAAATYGSVTERPSISIGVSVLEADSALTEEDALDRASKAKRAAKTAGKNRAAVWFEMDARPAVRSW